MGRPLVIGQRINPSGRPGFIAELRRGSLRSVLREAKAQEKAGADILDLNVGEGPASEADLMRKAVLAVQEAVDLPLAIDSRSPEALEAGLAACRRKPVLNSVNGTRQSLKEILPLARRFGTSMIALTMDEKGIPKTARGRLEIARRILKAAGIPREDVLVDCVAMPALLKEYDPEETWKALALVRKLGVRTVLGISNASFGLTDRGKRDAAFLAEALRRGLDCCILDPLSRPVRQVLKAAGNSHGRLNRSGGESVVKGGS